MLHNGVLNTELKVHLTHVCDLGNGGVLEPECIQPKCMWLENGRVCVAVQHVKLGEVIQDALFEGG